MLPLGHRVQKRLEQVIDRHMESLGASRLDLATICGEDLWEKSDRLRKAGHELFRFKDRKRTAYLLSPTHEEVITRLVGSTTKSYKELPVRLYQISRKYRDEMRPRAGLLRGREFTMKDLYTFDCSKEDALNTYESVQAAYKRVFADLRLPVITAKANSGEMGGNLSHEYLLPMPNGEDDLVTCGNCGYAANKEMAWRMAVGQGVERKEKKTFSQWGLLRGITESGDVVNVWYPVTDEYDVSLQKIKHRCPTIVLDEKDVMQGWCAKLEKELCSASKQKILNLIDKRLPGDFEGRVMSMKGELPVLPEPVANPSDWEVEAITMGFMRPRLGLTCPACRKVGLTMQRAIELGHTFHLGSTYSGPMGAAIKLPPGGNGNQEGNRYMEMGCHGIGISRLIAAAAEYCSDRRRPGLAWPRLMAPFDVVLVHPPEQQEAGQTLAVPLARQCGAEVLVDDRDVHMAQKLREADAIGYSVIIVIGKEWKIGKVEVQCNKLGLKEAYPVDDAVRMVGELLERKL